MTRPEIDIRLTTDSHELFSWNRCQIRLHFNATIPWVVIIPQTEQFEFFDLPADLQLEITHASKLIGDYFKTRFRCEKINFAAIGNVVSQLHIHVVGRHSSDPLWPDVVWGNPLPETVYQADDLAQIKMDLQHALGIKV